MRVLLFLALGTALAIALPQNDQTRRRGLRRFSLASPGLQSSARRQEATQDVAEPTVAAEEATPAETPQRVRGRGASLLRRGRPSRLRSPQVETAAVQEQVDEKVVEAPPQRQAGGRGSIRIRRPIRKPTKKTTTTTTTTSAPVTEDLITSPENPEAEISVDGSMQKDETEGTQSQIETKQMPADEMKKDITDVTKTKAEKAEAKPTKQIGPKLKLRPIPIKSARKNIKEETPEEVPAAPKDVTPTDQETTSSISEPVSSHRFSSRPKPPRIQSRRRQSAAVVPKPVPVQQTEIISDPVEAPVRQRLGGRGPTLRRPSSRLSPRGRNKIQSEEPAPEIVEETVGVEGAAAERPSTLSRFPNIKELKSIVRHEDEPGDLPQSRRKPKIVRPKFKRRRKTTPSPPKSEMNPTVEMLDEEPVIPERVVHEQETIIDPVPEVPVVQKGRPRGSKQPKIEVQEEVIAKFPSPNYGGSDLLIRGGEVQVTQIGTVEDSPIEEVRMILSGLGSRRRGLARPNKSQTIPPVVTPNVVDDSQIGASVNKDMPAEDVDYLYEYYDYLYDEANV